MVTTDLLLRLHRKNQSSMSTLMGLSSKELGAIAVTLTQRIAKLSIVGVGMRCMPVGSLF